MKKKNGGTTGSQPYNSDIERSGRYQKKLLRVVRNSITLSSKLPAFGTEFTARLGSFICVKETSKLIAIDKVLDPLVLPNYANPIVDDNTIGCRDAGEGIGLV